MIDPAIFFSLFIMGLVSSSHCIGMCGGIMGALGMAIPSHAKAARWMILVTYNFGRICSYTLMGLLVGLFAEQFAAMGGGAILRILAGTLLIAMGLYLADWWRGLTKLETLGRYLWVYLQPLGKPLMPVNSLPKALVLGALWGWLPCGLVYAALASAMTQPAPTLAASAMFAFGLGTLPAVLAAGIAAHQLTRIMQKRQVRIGLAIIIMMFGVWTIWGALAHSNHHHHAMQGGSGSDAMDHMTMDHMTTDHPMMDHATMDHTTMDHSAMDHSGMDHSKMDHSGMDHGATSQNTTDDNAIDQSATNQSTTDHSNMNHSAMSDSSAAALERQRTDIKNDMPENYPTGVTESSPAVSSADAASSESHIHHH